MEVACVILKDAEGRYFAARRAPGKSNAGAWEFPGGKLEEGESAAACAERELAEEFGMVVRCGEESLRVEAFVSGRSLRLRACPADLIEGARFLKDHDATGWFSLPGLMALSSTAAERALFAALADGGTGASDGAGGARSDHSAWPLDQGPVRACPSASVASR